MFNHPLALGLPLGFIAVILLARSQWYSAGSDLGYWIGVAGALQMLTLLLYPVRKYWSVLKSWGDIRIWFRVHMTFGVTGPLLIVAHSTLQFGSTNALVAFVSMSIVALSGLIGRFLYVHIHKGVYGEKQSLDEIRQLALSNEHALSGLPAQVVAELHQFEINMFKPLLAGANIARFWRAPQLGKQAMQNALRAMPLATAKNHFVSIKRFTDSVVRATQFQFYEQMFSLWHVAHVPFVFLLVFTAIAHVIAVHMY